MKPATEMTLAELLAEDCDVGSKLRGLHLYRRKIRAEMIGRPATETVAELNRLGKEKIRDLAVKHLDKLDGEDAESDHFAADEILCSVLRKLGAEDVANAFDLAAIRAKFKYA